MFPFVASVGCRVTNPLQHSLPTDATLGACTAEARDAFRRDLRVAQAQARSAVVPKRSRRKDGHWRVWEEYCADLGVDPYLSDTQQHTRVSLLQVFASRLRDGSLAPSNHGLRAGTVADYLRTVGEEVSMVGTHSDPRFDQTGQPVLVLRQQQRSFHREDPPPEKVKPIPVQLLRHAVQQCQADEFQRATADLLIIGFFYLLRPGEHCHNSNNNHPFRLRDVSFTQAEVAPAIINAAVIDLTLLGSASLVHLNFTTQKNGVPNEAVTHGVTTDPFLSPLHAVARRVRHLRHAKAPPDTPLHTIILPSGTTRRVTANDLTKALRASCRIMGHTVGVSYNDISARALRAGGAMALLRAGVDSTETRLMGRWRSWAMLEYLHRCAFDTTTFAARMLEGGSFTIQRHAVLPDDVARRLHLHLASVDAPSQAIPP